jgi:hypothetical protein
MSADISLVYLEDRETSLLVEASLYDCIQPKHLDDFEQLWKPLRSTQAEQHGHWDWRRKVTAFAGQLSFRSFAIQYSDQTQGMMIVNTTKRCRLQEQANKHLVYVDYLEAAPWNRRRVEGHPSYRGIGTVLVAAAIQLSMEEGNHGRVGLHSLPQADTFYRDKCGMTDLGPDASYPRFPLRYFEMTESQARSFMQQRR